MGGKMSVFAVYFPTDAKHMLSDTLCGAGKDGSEGSRSNSRLARRRNGIVRLTCVVNEGPRILRRGCSPPYLVPAWIQLWKHFALQFFQVSYDIPFKQYFLYESALCMKAGKTKSRSSANLKLEKNDDRILLFPVLSLSSRLLNYFFFCFLTFFSSCPSSNHWALLLLHCKPGSVDCT